MFALFREILIARRPNPDRVDTAYMAGLMTAIRALGLLKPFRVWCKYHGYYDVLDTLIP